MTKKKFAIRYLKSKFWLIFWLIIFFPIGLVLLINHTKIATGARKSGYEYEGNRFWLYFWAIFFFPLTIILFILNGAIVEKTS